MPCPRIVLVSGLSTVVLLLAACVQPEPVSSISPGGSAPSSSTPMPGVVTDLAGFERFIATRPTPQAFRQRYPDVTLVMPGMIATKEMRSNNSRYFAELDAEGRISGGRFQ